MAKKFFEDYVLPKWDEIYKNLEVHCRDSKDKWHERVVHDRVVYRLIPKLAKENNYELPWGNSHNKFSGGSWRNIYFDEAVTDMIKNNINNFEQESV